MVVLYGCSLYFKHSHALHCHQDTRLRWHISLCFAPERVRSRHKSATTEFAVLRVDAGAVPNIRRL
jgi:hypothetical protein